jgi:mRNA interferase RelE/StbE
MPTNEADRIHRKMQQYADDPSSLANSVKRLAGSDYLRLRVGDWRVVFREDGSVVAVIKVASRGSVYGQ